MLGPSIIFFSPPFALGYAMNASREQSWPRICAYMGVVLAAIEVLLLTVLVIVGALVGS